MSQSHTFKNFDDSNGLPSSEVYQIIQDDNHFIWFATDNGVVRYDGLRFETISVQQGLPDPVVFGFKKQGQRIWFRSFSGALSYHEHDSIHIYPYNRAIREFLNKSVLSSLAFDAEGRLWLGSSVDGSVAMVNATGDLRHFSQQVGTVFYREVGANDYLIGYSGDPTTVKQFSAQSVTAPLTLSDTTQFNAVISHTFWHGNLYFSINRNVFRFDGKGVLRVLESHSPILNLSLDRENSLWVGFLNDGVMRFRDPGLKDGEAFHELDGRSVTTALHDSQGGYWFSTLDRGVFYFPNLSIRFYDIDQDSKIASVSSHGGRIYTGNHRGEVMAFSTGSGKKTLIRSLGAAILTVFCDKDGKIWVSSVDETLVMDSHGSIIRKFAYLKRVKSFFQDKDGFVWSAGQDGVRRFDDDYNIIAQAETDGWPRMAVAGGQSVYVASLSGLTCYDAKLKSAKEVPGFAGLKISGITELAEGVFAIGTPGKGLFILRHGVPEKADGFFADGIYAMARDDSYLWLSTGKGLIRTSVDRLIHGRPEYHLLSQSSLSGEKNNFIVMAGDTLYAFSEKRISLVPLHAGYLSADFLPNVFVSLRVNDEPRTLSAPAVFAHHENNLKLWLRFVSFNNQDFLVRHRINGGAWSRSEARELSFYSLAPGTYDLEVEYLEANLNSWNPIVDYPFTITDPWWKSWYFKLSIFLFLVSSVTAIFWLKVRALNQRRHREIDLARKLRKERERIAKDLHDNVGAHLTALSLGLNDLSRRNRIDAILMEPLNRDVNTIIAELRDTIWAIHKEEVSIESLGDRIRDLLWRIQQRQPSLSCTLHIDVGGHEVRLTPVQAINLFRIIQEAIANSIKHGGGGILSVEILGKGDTLCVRILDNGRGFDLSSNGREGHYGLFNMKKRAAELNAVFTLASAPNEGTRIVVEMPCNAISDLRSRG